MDILHIVKQRYATKKFAKGVALTDEQINQLKQLLRLSPSSINAQPWHFVLATTDLGKQRIAKAAHGSYLANKPKILDSGMAVVFCAKQTLSDEYLQRITDKEAEDGRFPSEEGKALAMKVRRFYADLHRNTLNDVSCWTQSQVYLNIGNFLLGTAALGLDAVPIEGVDLKVLNAEFSLPEQDFSAVAVVAIGQHCTEDFNAKLPKSRLSTRDLFTEL